jgi:hypothetical protein
VAAGGVVGGRGWVEGGEGGEEGALGVVELGHGEIADAVFC